MLQQILQLSIKIQSETKDIITSHIIKITRLQNLQKVTMHLGTKIMKVKIL